MRNYNGSSGADRRSDRREQLIDAAIRIYAEQGQKAATVRRVCALAGLTERYYYESFSNGDELLAAALTRIVERLEGAIDADEASAETSGSVALTTKLTAYFEALMAHPLEARMFLVEMPGTSGAYDRLFDHAMDRFAAKLQHALDHTPQTAEETLVSLGVTGGILYLARRWINDDFRTPVPMLVAAARSLCHVTATRLMS